VILSIPLVLIVEIGDILEGHHWNIPKSLAAYANNPTVRAHGVNYTIAVHLYTNPSESHFMTHVYTNPSESHFMTHVYNYDGREHDENAVFNTANMKSLTGLSDSIAGIPDSYHLTAVVYYLDGGRVLNGTYVKSKSGLQTGWACTLRALAAGSLLHVSFAENILRLFQTRTDHLGFQTALRQSIMLSPLQRNHRKKDKHQELVFTDRTASFPSVPVTRSMAGILQWPLLEVSPQLVQFRSQAFLQLPPFCHLHTKPALHWGTLKHFGVSPAD
jgi:hypothetical protein